MRDDDDDDDFMFMFCVCERAERGGLIYNLEEIINRYGIL